MLTIKRLDKLKELEHANLNHDLKLTRKTMLEFRLLILLILLLLIDQTKSEQCRRVYISHIIHYTNSTLLDCRNEEAKLIDVNGNEGRVGLVQVCDAGTWYTACRKKGWNPHAANVVCRQLGYLEQGYNKTML